MLLDEFGLLKIADFGLSILSPERRTTYIGMCLFFHVREPTISFLNVWAGLVTWNVDACVCSACVAAIILSAFHGMQCGLQTLCQLLPSLSRGYAATERKLGIRAVSVTNRAPGDSDVV